MANRVFVDRPVLKRQPLMVSRMPQSISRLQRAKESIQNLFRKVTGTEAQYFDKKKLVKILGSLVPSEMTDTLVNRFRHFGLTNETKELYFLYQELRQLYNSEVLLDAATKRLSRGAVMSGFQFDIEPKVQSAEARAEAKWSKWLLEPIAEMLNGDLSLAGYDYTVEEDQPVTMADTSEMLCRYANLPIQLLWDTATDTQILGLKVMPPFAWTKNSDHKLQWFDNQKAYFQHDADSWKEGQDFRAKDIVWCMGYREPWERYAVPRALNARIHVRGLIQLFEDLPDARKHGSPRTVYFTDNNGKARTFEEMMRLFETMPQEMAKRGEIPSVWDFDQILNGIRDAKTLSVSTDFFNQFGDADAFSERIALAYDLVIGTLLRQQFTNRATLEFLMRLESIAQRGWANILTRSVIFPVFRRALIEANINTRLIKAVVTWQEAKTPEEMVAEAQFAQTLWYDGVISREGYQAKGCAYVGLDPKTEEQRIANEKLKGIEPPQIQRGSVNMRLHSNLPMQLPGSNIAQQMQPTDPKNNAASNSEMIN